MPSQQYPRGLHLIFSCFLCRSFFSHPKIPITEITKTNTIIKYLLLFNIQKRCLFSSLIEENSYLDFILFPLKMKSKYYDKVCHDKFIDK